jgi:hypothetical protein
MRKLIIGVPVIVLLFAVALGTYWLTNSSEPTVVKESGGTSEGIKVHGNWEVKVTDPNSGQENLYAFSNDLIDYGSNDGANLIGQIFTGNTYSPYDPSKWKIYLRADNLDTTVFPNGYWTLCEISDITPIIHFKDNDPFKGGDGFTIAGSCQSNTPKDATAQYVEEPITTVLTSHDMLGDFTIKESLSIPVSFEQLISVSVHVTFD